MEKNLTSLLNKASTDASSMIDEINQIFSKEIKLCNPEVSTTKSNFDLNNITLGIPYLINDPKQKFFILKLNSNKDFILDPFFKIENEEDVSNLTKEDIDNLFYIYLSIISKDIITFNPKRIIFFMSPSAKSLKLISTMLSADKIELNPISTDKNNYGYRDFDCYSISEKLNNIPCYLIDILPGVNWVSSSDLDRFNSIIDFNPTF